MIKLPLQFLISTSKKILLYNNGIITDIDKDNGVYFGLCHINNIGYAALARNNYSLKYGMGGDPNGANSLEIFDKNFIKIHSLKLDIIKDGHQLLYKDDFIYFCNSGRNLITKIRFDGYVENIAPFKFFGSDFHHINSIKYHNGYYYIVSHRTSVGSDDGSITVYDSNWSLIHLIKIGDQSFPHDVVIKNGFLYTCNSKDGKIISYELSNFNKKEEYIIDGNRITRGLLITNEFLLCGLSEFDTRENRHFNKLGMIYAYKYPEMEFIGKMELDGAGQCNDLLLVG